MDMPRLRTLLTTAVAAATLLTGAAGAQAGEHRTRIVGGSDVPAGKYDAVAHVSIAGAFSCTGTLIASEWVLTAGHCSSVTGGAGQATPIAFPPPLVKVTLGTNRTDDAGGTTIAADRIEIPRDYLAVDGYDISLLHLSTAAPASIRPIQIAGIGSRPLWSPGVSTIIAGFGVTASGGDAPAVMQEARVPIVTDGACASVYRGFEPATQVCAGYPEGGVDTCQGDSGGPMFGTDAVGALKVVGATSYGDGCGQPNTPGVYARVSDTTLREYIRSVVGDAAIDDRIALASPATEVPATSPSATPMTSVTPAPPGMTTTSSASPADAAPGSTPASESSAAPTKTCKVRKVTVRLKARFAKRVRSAVVFVDGKRVGTLRGAKASVKVDLGRSRPGTTVVKIVMTLRNGKKQTDTRRLKVCSK